MLRLLLFIDNYKMITPFVMNKVPNWINFLFVKERATFTPFCSFLESGVLWFFLSADPDWGTDTPARDESQQCHEKRGGRQQNLQEQEQ